MKEFAPILRQGIDTREVFDPVRRRYVVLTPEEFVRQHLIHYLTSVKGVPINCISVEKAIKVNRLLRRIDLAVYTRELKIAILIECKAPEIRLSQEVLDQAFRYNLTLKAPYIAVTNGEGIICCRADYLHGNHHFTNDLPDFESLQ
jgi:hypothetical protein